jgi:3D (Asp-Asp-Asp) domain-containing protein
VLGQAHTAPRRALLLVLGVIVMLVTPALVGANPARHAAQLRATNAELARHARSAVLEVYALDHRLASAHVQLLSLEQQTQSLREQRALLTKQIGIAQRGSKLTEARLGTRLRALYEEGNVEPLEILFGSASLDDAMTNLDGLSRLSGDAEDVLRELKAVRSKLAEASRQLSSRERALAAAIRAAEATRAALARAKAAKASYVAKLATRRRLNDRQIDKLLKQARAAQMRSVRSSAETASTISDVAASLPSRASAQSGHTIAVTATGYSLGGNTSSGLPVGWGVAAVDPAVIPLGTHMDVPGYGEAVAADTGGSVVGSSIDLWFPTVAQANAWGRRTVTIVLQ